MTPKFSLGISIAPRFFMREVGWILSPTTTVQWVMRFYWGLPSKGSSGSGDSSFEYDGWRYIGK
jgi:hypothetical protein